MPTNLVTEARLEAALRAVDSANRCEVGAMLALYHCAKAILPDLIAEVRELRKIRAHIPGLVYIKAEEAAGFGTPIRAARMEQDAQ